MTTIDLSHALESGMPVYPGNPPVEIERTATIEADGYATSSIAVDSHTGTHVDAPAHMVDGAPTLDEFPPETFRFSSVVADCRPLEPREPIGRERVREGVPNDLAGADLLVVRTGWERHWGTEAYFDHPYLTADAAEWLAERELHVGIDALNVDPTPTANAREDDPDGYPVHHVLFGSERLLVENLRNLESVPSRFELHAYPLAVADADGSPVRAVAVIE